MAGEDDYKKEALDGGTYSELLFADDDDDGLGGCFSFATSSSPKMLCFGTSDNPIIETCSVQTPPKTQKSEITCSRGGSPSACSSNNISKPNNYSNRKRNVAEKESDAKTKAVAAGNQRNSKRTKQLVENSNVTAHAKVKKEKLGERITALQQLVSPFGKTDTASVLHEAMGYIKFLHDQVQVLCSPYLQRQHQLSPSLREGEETEASRKEVLLRSKGLCLVPIELTLHVAHTNLNGADFWSPAAMMNNNINQ